MRLVSSRQLRCQLVTLAVVSGILIAGTVSAHQPIVVDSAVVVTVTEPEISKAYYAELTGAAANYHFTADNNFALYVNILVPDIASSTEDYTVTIMRNGLVVATLDPKSEPWKRLDEPYGHDVYRQGPEYRVAGLPGDYNLVVSSPDNQGQYVLAIGETESFPLSEIIRTIKELPDVKKFFGKSGWAVFASPFVYGAAIGLFVLVVIIVILIVRWRKNRVVNNIEKDIRIA